MTGETGFWWMFNCIITQNFRNFNSKKHRIIWQFNKLVKRSAKKKIRKIMANFLRQTRFFFEFSHYFDKYRDKVVKIQKFYQSIIWSRFAVLSKLWSQECKSIIQDDQRQKKVVPKDMEFYMRKLAEGFSEVSLEDVILNIKA